jgi:ABC-type glycerol-3-phosphate transport system substrate-binding protein
MKIQTLLLSLAVAAGLAACGGGGGGDPVAPAATNEVPASATVSATAYTEFAKTLQNSDVSQPLDVQSVKPPTSETDAPLSL